jgi:anti-sigma regulatory factor (Ser/Thr protein kinase)
MQRTFKRSQNSLNLVFDFVNQFVKSRGIEQRTAFELQLAVEEVFINLTKYNPKPAPILLSLEDKGDKIMTIIQDTDSDNYDVTKPPPVDTHAPLEGRRAGGLGLFLVHKVMDQVEHHFENNVSTITLVKKIK